MIVHTCTGFSRVYRFLVFVGYMHVQHWTTMVKLPPCRMLYIYMIVCFYRNHGLKTNGVL